MKIVLRALLAVASLPIAYFAAWYAEDATVLPLGKGVHEGTPLTMVAGIGAFSLVLIVVLVLGNILIGRYPRL